MTLSSSKPAPAPGGLGLFEKWLSLWVALAMAAGLALGGMGRQG